MRLLQTYKADMLNGVGLRNVYFFSGCTHHCKGCFNPETWEPNTLQGKKWEFEDFLQMISDTKKDYIDGITLTGGDPLSPWNEAEIIELCKDFKEFLPDKTIWLYTGFTYEQILASKSYKWEVLKYIDVLCDGRYVDTLKSPTKPWVGSENQRVIDVKATIKAGEIVLYNHK